MEKEFTQQDLENWKDLDSRFKKRLIDIIQLAEEIKGKKPYIDEEDIIHIEFHKGKIIATVEVSSNCSCCPDYTENHTIQESYVFDSDWENKYRTQLAEETEKKRQLELENAKKKQEKLEAEEKELLAKLQKKYKEN